LIWYHTLLDKIYRRSDIALHAWHALSSTHKIEASSPKTHIKPDFLNFSFFRTETIISNCTYLVLLLLEKSSVDLLRNDLSSGVITLGEK
jgi:hypothetical protein